MRLLQTIHSVRASGIPEDLDSKIDSNIARIEELAVENGIFLNRHTLEVDLFEGGLADPILTTLAEAGFGPRRRCRVQRWRAAPKEVESQQLLQLIDSVGKGRFAQRLAPLLADEEPPDYIANAIRFVVDRV